MTHLCTVLQHFAECVVMEDIFLKLELLIKMLRHCWSEFDETVRDITFERRVLIIRISALNGLKDACVSLKVQLSSTFLVMPVGVI